MFDRLRKILEGKKELNETVDPGLSPPIAACVLLLEAAHIDDECTGEEMDHIIHTLKTRYEITPEYIDELIELAHSERSNALDLWQFTNRINQHSSVQERTAIMEDVWRIIQIDGKLQAHEDHFAHKIGNLLRLTHSQLIAAKLKARDQLQG